ncbi:MAG: DUF3795 domain-containing protein [Clostridia bacterium]|nr:DUF3795 domain-containing protein [Clostridia bacterium]
MEKALIAPCGMNCNLCYAYQREKNRCTGCNIDIATMPNSCQKCIIRNCEHVINSKSGFCYECKKYPCRRLNDLDKRYRTKYSMSMLENLQSIKVKGLDEFVKNEAERWKCPQCGNIVCVHRKVCSKCSFVYRI